MTAGDRCIDIDDDRLSKPERATLLAACRVVALSLMLPATGPAWAGFDDGMAAVKRGDYQVAYEIWLPLAKRGDIVAQANFGTLDSNGLGVEQDDVQAHMWFNLAASRTQGRKARRRLMSQRDSVAARLRTNSWPRRSVWPRSGGPRRRDFYTNDP